MNLFNIGSGFGTTSVGIVLTNNKVLTYICDPRLASGFAAMVYQSTIFTDTSDARTQ